MLKRYFGDKKFYKSVFVLIIPIMLQQLLVSIAGYVDNLMVNSLSDVAYNGVSAANRLMFIVNFLYFGLTAGASIFIAQYFGADKKEEVKKSVCLSLIASVILGVIVTIVIALSDKLVVNSFVQDSVARQYGYDYLNVIKYGAILIAVNFAFANAFRSVKMPRVALISAIIGIVVNVLLNYCLIFGKFGFPRLEASGAALATVISKVAELMVFILVLLFYKKVYFRNLFNRLRISKSMIKEFVKKAIPLVFNELLWSLGMVLFAVFYTYKNDFWYNAYAYSQNISDLFFIVFSGLGNGTAVFIGTRLGKNEFMKAEQEFNYFKGLGVMMGIIVGGLMFLTAPLTSRMFTNDPNTIKLVVNLLRITAVFTAIYCYNAVCFFTLRAGGDSIRAFVLDQVPTYLIGLPICIFLGVNASLFGISIIVVYLVTHLLDIAKIVMANSFIRKRKWLNNLTTVTR